MTVRTISRPAGRRGPRESEDYNAFQDEVIADLQDLDKSRELLANQMTEIKKVLFSEMENLRARVDGQDALLDYSNRGLAVAGGTLTFFEDFRSSKNLSYTLAGNNVADVSRLRYDSRYGQLLAPYDRAVSRFFVPVIKPNQPTTTMVPSVVTATVTAVSESGGTVFSGTPLNALNGHNQDYWVRQVEFPLESDVAEVQIQYDVTVPSTFYDKANLLTIHPYPLGQVDIVSVLYSTDASAPSLSFTGFPAAGVPAAGHYRLHFSPVVVTKLRVTLRQRNFIERNGVKVFQYGMQELSLQLIEFDTTVMDPSSPPAVTGHNTIYVTATCPEGYNFDTISGFFCSTQGRTGQIQYATAASNTPAVLFRIYTGSGLVAPVWNSYSDASPQALPVDVSGALTNKLYIVVQLGREVTLTSLWPVLENFGFQYTVSPA